MKASQRKSSRVVSPEGDMEIDGVCSQFEVMTMSNTPVRGQCRSLDDGYHSQSMNSADFKDICCMDNINETNHLSYRADDNSCTGHVVPGCESVDAMSVFIQDEDGDTHLHVGIIQRQITLVTWFISLAVSPDWLNISNRLLQTPLHVASIVQDAVTTRRLMTSGASVEVRDLHGNTPLHIACRDGCEDVVKALLNPITYPETMYCNYEVPYQIIPQNLELANYDGYTCVHLAAMGAHLSVLDLLISYGADVNSRERKSGRTALHLAAESNNMRLVTFLLKQPHITVDAETYGGLTPLSLSAGRGFDQVMNILIVHGACDVTDRVETSPDDDGSIYGDI